MKCERCNANIKKGELFCSNCGVEVAKKELENTNTLEVNKIIEEKDIKNDVKDLFTQSGNEKGTNPVNIFLIILVLLLIVGIVYLIFFDTYIIKREQKIEVIEEKEIENTVYYNNISLTLDNDIVVRHKEDKLELTKQGMNSSLYMVNDNYDDIIDNIDEIILKWNEQGLKIDSKDFLNDNTYRLYGTYMYNNYALYIMKLSDSTIILEASFDTVDIYNSNKSYLERILSEIKINTNDTVSNLIYPEFNLNPIGSQ